MEFKDYDIDLMMLRRKGRKNELSQKEYGKFLEVWYNILLNANATEKKETLSQLLKYIGGGTVLNGIPITFLIAKYPSRKDLPKYYILLYKFLSSFAPLGPSVKEVSKVLHGYLNAQKYTTELLNKTNGMKSMQYKNGKVTFHV